MNDLQIYVLFNISGRWTGDNEMLRAIERYPPPGIDLWTALSSRPALNGLPGE